VGFQVAAAGIGGAVLPGLTGVLADDIGLEMIALFLVVASLAQVVLYEATRMKT
jgi:fucose permease